MKYIFIHIGKTGGTSFGEFLESNVRRTYRGYGKTYYLTHEDPGIRNANRFFEAERRGRRVFDDFDLFMETAPYGLHQYLDTHDYQYITMLREPIARTLSAYRYSIDRNWYSSDTDIVDWFHAENNRDKKHYQINYVSGMDIDRPARLKLDRAMEHLEDDRLLFGFNERYNEFIALCCRINNWTPRHGRLNVTRSDVPVDDEAIGRLRDLLADEIQFYSKAVELYDRKYGGLIDQLDVESKTPGSESAAGRYLRRLRRRIKHRNT